MDKVLILAVAGSGKTTLLINRLDRIRRVLLLTYTRNNEVNLRKRVCDRFGYQPDNIRIETYFQFLNSFCFRPYFADATGCNGITFKSPPDHSRFSRTDTRYFNPARQIYSNRLSTYVQSERALEKIQRRLARYYDAVFVDEAQDFGGGDFPFMLALASAKVEMLWVGDFYQHTYDTSTDGNVTLGLYQDVEKYQKRMKDAGFTIDVETLGNSHRCASGVCTFITDTLGIAITSASTRDAKVIDVSTSDEAQHLFRCDRTPKLFYRQHTAQGCTISENWGGSKGLQYEDDVCVVLNETTLKQYRANDLKGLAPQTKNKLYVACSRARGNVYLLPHTLLGGNGSTSSGKRPAPRQQMSKTAASSTTVKTDGGARRRR